jgi:prolyl oligopeptidase
MLRYQRFPGARDWVSEYGSSDNADQFKWLWAYSPYQRVQSGTKYPAVLMTAVEDDPSVSASHARKMTAALQASTVSDLGDHPILLRVDRTPDRDPDAIVHSQLQDLVDQRVFLMWQLGMLSR